MADNIIGNLVKSQESLNRQFVGYSDSISTRRIGVENIELRPITKINTRDLSSSSFILSHYTQCLMPSTSSGTGYYLDELADDGVTIELVRVINKDNTYVENFETNNFINTTNTTANIEIGTRRISFGANQVYESEIIGLNNTAYTQISMVPLGVTTKLTPYYSMDGGSTYTSTTFNNAITSTNTSTDGVCVKVIASSLASSTNDYLNKLTVTYS